MPTDEYTPTLENVGALVRTRTKDDQGVEIGTFNDKTIPTDAEVNELIAQAVEESFPVFGEDIPDSPGADKGILRRSARRLVALRAAALVEIVKAPEQVTRGTSPYQQYQDAWEKGLVRVGKAISEAGVGDIPGAQDDLLSAIDSGFPVDAGGMVGWGTAW